MLGTFLGVLFLGVLKNGLIISSISVYWQGVITGVVLFASVMIDRFRRRHTA
jgi:ribose transport system permease protein